MKNGLPTGNQERDRLASSCTITMWIDVTGGIFVRSCEILGDSFRNRTSFGNRSSLESAFSDIMTASLRDCLAKLSMRTEVLSLPSYSIELPQLALYGPRIVATQLTDGTINVIMRFRSFMGSIGSAFRGNVGFDFKLADFSASMSAEVLQEIASPLLDIISAMESGPAVVTEKLGSFGRYIAARSHEIRFQVELLNRFTQQQSQLAEDENHKALPKLGGPEMKLTKPQL